jgi:hypothetical protein
VLIGFLPSARVGDMAVCVGPPDSIAMGSPTVLIGNMMAARIGDPTVHGGVIVMGEPTVMIGIPGMGSVCFVAAGQPGMGASGTPLSEVVQAAGDSPIGDALASVVAAGQAAVDAAVSALTSAAEAARAIIAVGPGCGPLCNAAGAPKAPRPEGQPALVNPADNPPYEPDRWNAPPVKRSTNCYAYAANDPDGHPPGKPQPGQHSGQRLTAVDCPTVSAAATADGMIPAPRPPVNQAGYYLVALVSAPGQDYHWYRQGNDGLWSQKHGNGSATNLDEAGNVITSPETCNRDGSAKGMPNYTDFCGYFYVPAGGIRTGPP